MIRVLVVDDQPLVRAGFRMLLQAEDDLTVVGEAADGAAGVRAAAELRPDVVLMDVRMPVLDGIEATRRVLAAGGAGEPPRVLVLTTFEDDEYVFAALRAGAAGFLLKDAEPAEIVAAIRVVAAGDAALAPRVARLLIAELGTGRPEPGRHAAELARLTPREADVVRLVARGRSNAEIGAELFVSASTVKTHMTAVLAKLGLRDRVQVAIFAYESGLVRSGS